MTVEVRSNNGELSFMKHGGLSFSKGHDFLTVQSTIFLTVRFTFSNCEVFNKN